MSLVIQRQRKNISVEAAKLLSDGFVQDYHAAKIKALKKLGLPSTFELPTNKEVEDELKQHQLIGDINDVGAHARLILKMRTEALSAMKMFNAFSPRLVGDVYEGTATLFSPIVIQLFSDFPKAIVIQLLEMDVPFDTEDRKMKLTKVEALQVPVYSFGLNEFEYELISLAPKYLRQSPLSRITGLPMARASIKKLTKMIYG